MQKVIKLIIAITFIAKFTSCTVVGINSQTRVFRYNNLDTLKDKTVPTYVEVYMLEQHPNLNFSYVTVAEITITGGIYDTGADLLLKLKEKASKMYCDAVIYVEFSTTKRDISRIDPFRKPDEPEKPEDKEAIVKVITGRAVRKIK